MFIILLTLSALFILYTKNPLHAVLGLILIFINSAFLLLSLHADFLALIYIVVYVGAICVLFLFVIMLLNLRTTDMANKPIYKNEFFPYLLGYIVIAIAILMAYTGKTSVYTLPEVAFLIQKNDQTTFIVTYLFENTTAFVLLIALLFLAIVAPIAIAKKKQAKAVY